MVCFDESPTPTHRRGCSDRSWSKPASSSTTIASTSATAPSVCSSSLTRAPALGARLTSPTAAPRPASPPACATVADGHLAERIRALLDNMPTHSVGALYQAFLSAEARRRLCWLQFHYVPKHANWLTWPRSRLACCAASSWIGGSNGHNASCPRWGLGATTQCLARPHQIDVHN